MRNSPEDSGLPRSAGDGERSWTSPGEDGLSFWRFKFSGYDFCLLNSWRRIEYMPDPTAPDSIAETVKSLDEAIGEFHRIKENARGISSEEGPSGKAEGAEPAAKETPLVPID